MFYESEWFSANICTWKILILGIWKPRAIPIFTGIPTSEYMKSTWNKRFGALILLDWILIRMMNSSSKKSVSWGYWSSFLTFVTFCCLFLEGLQQVGGRVNVVYNPRDCSSRLVAEAEVAHHPSGGCGGAWALWQADLPCTLCGLSTQLHMYKAECYSSLEMTGWLLYTCAV